MYKKTEWTNRRVERADTFKVIDNGDGTKTLKRAEGTIFNQGTPVSAENMNNIEQGIADAHTEVDKYSKRLDGKNVQIGEMAKTTDESIALGYLTTSLGRESIAIGGWATEARGELSIAMGQSATARGERGLALGASSAANYKHSVAIGRTAASKENEIALGNTSHHTVIAGDLSVKGTKNFEIPHPKPSKSADYTLRHATVETNTAGDNLYRYKVESENDNGVVEINLPDYFVWLNKNVQVFVTGQNHFGNGYGYLDRDNEKLIIHCELKGEYNVLAIGTRNDEHKSVQEWKSEVKANNEEWNEVE